MAAEVHVALLTPAADGGGRVDELALAAHVRWLAGIGVDGMLVAGTTGEGPLLEDRDVVRAITCTAEATAGGGLQVIAQVGRPGTEATVALARAAADAGATAVAVVVPYYFAYDDEQLLRHYAAVATASPLPVIAYTIPARTNNDISPELLGRLADEGIAGIKDSSKSLERHLEYLEVARRRDLRVYMGSDGLAVSALRSGATGLMSAIANAVPERLVELRDAVAQSDWQRAESIQTELTALRTRLAEERPLVVLKREVSHRLAAIGERYPATLRQPLG